MIRVRFNLGRGENFKKWKLIFEDDRDPIHLDPGLTQMVLIKPKLINRRGSAESIYKGKNKFVCAWVECEDVLVGSFEVDERTEVSYNPRVVPYWVEDGEDVDLKQYDRLVTNGNKIFRELIKNNHE